MAVMDEFKEERESIKDASPEKKWNYFKDYYLKWVIIGLVVLAAAVSFVVSILSQKEEVLLVELVNFAESPEAELYVKETFEEQFLTDPKKQRITLDADTNIQGLADTDGALTDAENMDITEVLRYSYEDEQKLATFAMTGSLDLLISGQSVIERLAQQHYFIPLDTVFDADELKGRELLYSDGYPVAICLDDAKLLHSYYAYSGEEEHIYAAFASAGSHLSLAKDFFYFIR